MSESPVSSTQRRKFDQFQSLPSADDAMTACRAVLSAAGLRQDQLGTHWGVTVCVEQGSQLRLNVGNRILFEVTDDNQYDVFLIHSGRIPFRWIRYGQVRGGFAQVKDSIVLRADRVKDVQSFVGARGIAKKLSAHAEASWRTLPKPDWHNPLVSPLLFP